MVIVDIIRLVLVFSLGAYAAVTDLRWNKIGNKIVLPAIAIGLLLDLICYVLIDRTQFISLLINTGIVLSLALLLYALHIWAGGDAKLLFAEALLYPVGFYWDSGYSFYYIYAGMFSVGFIYLTIESLVLQRKEKPDISAKSVLTSFGSGVCHYAMTLVYIAALGHLYLLFCEPYFNLPSVVFTAICLFAVWGMQSIRIFDSKILVLVTLIFDIVVSCLTGNITVSTFWGSYIVVLAFMLLRLFVNRFNYQTVETKDIHKGMVLSRVSSMQFTNSRVSGLPQISDESLKSRLTEDEAESIHRWEHSKYGTSTLVIVRKTPFAIFILMGFVLYFLAGEFLL